MVDVTIDHHPNCGTSRNTLALIRHSGAEPQIIEYLKTPPTKAQLKKLIAAMGLPVREAKSLRHAVGPERRQCAGCPGPRSATRQRRNG